MVIIFINTKIIFKPVNKYVYVIKMQVQVRLPEKMVHELDKWVHGKQFKSRSDAIRSILSLYREREKTREFYKLLLERSKEAENEEILIPLGEA